MADTETLHRLKMILGDVDDDDATLLAYLDQARDVILNWKYPDMDETEYSEAVFPGRYISKQIQIAVWMLNKRGAEGEVQHIENGIHRNYKYADVPTELLRDIPPMCGIPH